MLAIGEKFYGDQKIAFLLRIQAAKLNQRVLNQCPITRLASTALQSATVKR